MRLHLLPQETRQLFWSLEMASSLGRWVADSSFARSGDADRSQTITGLIQKKRAITSV